MESQVSFFTADQAGSTDEMNRISRSKFYKPNITLQMPLFLCYSTTAIVFPVFTDVLKMTACLLPYSWTDISYSETSF